MLWATGDGHYEVWSLTDDQIFGLMKDELALTIAWDSALRRDRETALYWAYEEDRDG